MCECVAEKKENGEKIETVTNGNAFVRLRGTKVIENKNALQVQSTDNSRLPPLRVAFVCGGVGEDDGEFWEPMVHLLVPSANSFLRVGLLLFCPTQFSMTV